MTTNDLLLDFTSPGAIPPDPAEVIRQMIDETQTTMQKLEVLLTTERIGDMTAWRLLAMFYLATARISDLAKIENQYQEISGISLLENMKLGYFHEPNRENVSSPVIFELPKKITADTLPDNATIQDACHSPSGALLDFTRVHQADNNGLKKLAELFSFFLRKNIKPKIRQISHFIASLQSEAEKGVGTRPVWEVLFAWERFRNDREAFEERAIRFAIRYEISPPSWENEI